MSGERKSMLPFKATAGGKAQLMCLDTNLRPTITDNKTGISPHILFNYTSGCDYVGFDNLLCCPFCPFLRNLKDKIAIKLLFFGGEAIKQKKYNEEINIIWRFLLNLFSGIWNMTDERDSPPPHPCSSSFDWLPPFCSNCDRSLYFQAKREMLDKRESCAFLKRLYSTLVLKYFSFLSDIKSTACVLLGVFSVCLFVAATIFFTRNIWGRVLHMSLNITAEDH